MVTKLGVYPWREGMTLRELVVLARGPKVGADLREAEIARMPDDRSRGQLATTVPVPLDSSYLLEHDSTGRYAGPPGPPFPPSGPAPAVALQAFTSLLTLKQRQSDFQPTLSVAG